MAVDIALAGFVGIAFEAVAGTYVAPTKFFPIRSESVQWTQSTNFRRVIRGVADPLGAIAGNGHVEGDIDMELLSDVLPYFLRCARGTMTKTGTDDPATAAVESGPPFTYAFKPSASAVPAKTMSITVVRSGQVFGYVGCVVSSMTFGVDNDMATSTFTMLGRSEATQAAPVAAYNAAGDPYFGSGNWTLEIPTATQVFDSDEFSLQIEDNGEPQFRLKNVLGAQFIKYGERNVTLSVTRDFDGRAEYDAFKALTAKSVTVRVARGNESVRFVVPASIVDSYDLSLSGIGDLVRASVSYQGVHNAATGGGYTVTVVTAEDIAVA